ALGMSAGAGPGPTAESRHAGVRPCAAAAPSHAETWHGFSRPAPACRAGDPVMSATGIDSNSAGVPRRRRRRSVGDVLVVGGGMAGAAAALALARAGMNVTLVEARRPLPWNATDEVDLRVVALAPSAVACLDELGVWAAVREARAQ